MLIGYGAAVPGRTKKVAVPWRPSGVSRAPANSNFTNSRITSLGDLARSVSLCASAREASVRIAAKAKGFLIFFSHNVRLRPLALSYPDEKASSIGLRPGASALKRELGSA